MKALKTKKTKKSKQPNDEGKPKRSLNVYNLFFAIERQKIQNEQANVGFANLARTVSERWKTIDPVYKQQLEEQARLDRIRFENEMEVWRAKKEAKERNEPTELGEKLGENPTVVSIPRNISAFQSFNTQPPNKQMAMGNSASLYNNFPGHQLATADLNEAQAHAFFLPFNPPPQPNFLPYESAAPPTSDATSIIVEQEIAEPSRHYGLNIAPKTRRRHRPMHSLDDYTFVYETEEEQPLPVSWNLPSAGAQEFPYSGFYSSDMTTMDRYNMPSQYQAPALVSLAQSQIADMLHDLGCYPGFNMEISGNMKSSAMTPLPFAPAVGDMPKVDKPSSEEVGEFISSILSL